MKITLSILLLSVAVLSGCTDADMKKVSAFGEPGEIVCYSGGKEFYRARSTGKIQTEAQSDGWYFEEQGTGKLVRVSGTCIIRN